MSFEIVIADDISNGFADLVGMISGKRELVYKSLKMPRNRRCLKSCTGE
jgi:hypothetical protein